MKAKSKITVAGYINQQIELSEKSQKDIAREVGFDKPNIITMIKQGITKLPINKIGPMAVALGVDPIHLLRITLHEYMPETWQTIESLIGNVMTTTNERDLILLVRKATGGREFGLNGKREAALTALFSQFADEDEVASRPISKAVTKK